MINVNLETKEIKYTRKAPEYKTIAYKTVGFLFKKNHPIVKPDQVLLFTDENGYSFPIPCVPYDYSSKPVFSWPIVGKPSTHKLPSRIHDFSYCTRIFGKGFADRFFLSVLRMTEKNGLISRLMYKAVDLFGYEPYRASDERFFMAEYIHRHNVKYTYKVLLETVCVAYYPNGAFSLDRHPELEKMSYEEMESEYVNYLVTGKSKYVSTKYKRS